MHVNASKNVQNFLTKDDNLVVLLALTLTF